MNICLIGLFLAVFQATSDGAPERLFPAPKLPADVSQEEKLVEKRAMCTDDQLDKYPLHCPGWAAKGYCSVTYVKFMQTNCYASCGNCEVPTTPVPKVDEDACLAAHNAKRALHQDTNPLTWSDTLAKNAKRWADELARDNKFEHDPNLKGEGENLSWYSSSGGTVMSCAKAVDSWYSEIKDYDYNDPKFGSKTGHFTQVVWKGTTHVGAALVKKVNSKGYTETYIVARYSPPGNFRGQFANNVMPTK